jgi:hypothetical protein
MPHKKSPSVTGFFISFLLAMIRVMNGMMHRMMMNRVMIHRMMMHRFMVHRMMRIMMVLRHRQTGHTDKYHCK